MAVWKAASGQSVLPYRASSAILLPVLVVAGNKIGRPSKCPKCGKCHWRYTKTTDMAGVSTGANVMITFAPTQAKFVRLTQTATTENAPVWSITQLRLFEIKAGPR